MLNADSSTLKSESDDQSRKAAPTIPSEVALRWIVRIASTMLETEALGKIFWSSVDEVARLVDAAREARAARARGRGAGRTRAARSRRSSPRGACPGRRRTSRRSRGYALVVACAADGRRASAIGPDRDLVADRGRRSSLDARRLARSRRRSTSRRGRGARPDRAGAARRGRAAPATAEPVAQLEVATGEGSVFLVRDERAGDRGDDRPGADRRPRLLRPEELPAQRSREEKPKPRPKAPKKERGRCRGVRS